MAFKLFEEIGGELDPPHEWYCQIVREGTEHEFVTMPLPSG
jgi:hypothetical protein